MLLETIEIDKKIKTIQVFSKMKKPKQSIVYDTYWRFAAERQEVFFNRVNKHKAPWTDDNILSQYKFTNAYRAADRVSQYLIRNVIYTGNNDFNEVFFRILLFKLFNKIETWQYIEKIVGEITYETYNYKTYNEILENVRSQGKSIYSGAYIMASGRSAYGYSFKHQNHLKLLEEMMRDNLPEKIKSLKKMEMLFDLLKSYPTIGSFLAYQFSIDINYSTLTNFSEMEFVKAGPGAKDGIKKCFTDLGDYTEEDIIKMMAENQQKEFHRLNIEFKALWSRPLQLIDCQNLFCEVDKYSRVAHPEINGISTRKRIKQKFHASHLKQIEYYFPEKWNINKYINK